MIKLALFASIMFITSHVFAVESSLELGHIAQACHIAHSSNDSNKAKCLKNVKKSLEININNSYQVLKSRDLTHLLNTKALELELLKNSCGSLATSEIVKLDCEVQSDLSLVRYIGDRYEDK